MRQRGVIASFGTALLILLARLPSPAGAAAATDAAPTLKTDVQPIFDRECTRCHGEKKQKARLNLSAATARQALVNQPADEVPELMRVTPGDPERSYLWQKLQHKAAKGKGMPRGIFTARRLPEAQLEVIRKWIEAGAPE
jgi:cytochrome c553